MQYVQHITRQRSTAVVVEVWISVSKSTSLLPDRQPAIRPAMQSRPLAFIVTDEVSTLDDLPILVLTTSSHLVPLYITTLRPTLCLLSPSIKAKVHIAGFAISSIHSTSSRPFRQTPSHIPALPFADIIKLPPSREPNPSIGVERTIATLSGLHNTQNQFTKQIQLYHEQTKGKRWPCHAPDSPDTSRGFNWTFIAMVQNGPDV